MSPVPQAEYVGREIVDLATAEVHVGHARMWCLQKDAQRCDCSRTQLCDSPECRHTIAGARSGSRSDHMARAAPSFSQTVTRDNTVDLLGVRGMHPSTQQYLTQQEEDEPDVSHAPPVRLRRFPAFPTAPHVRRSLQTAPPTARGGDGVRHVRRCRTANMVSRYRRLRNAHKWYAAPALVTRRSKAHLAVRLRRRLSRLESLGLGLIGWRSPEMVSGAAV